MNSTLLSNRRHLPTFFSCLFFIAFVINAHSQRVSGLVRSAADNQPLSGVSVQVKGSSNGTTTDEKGHYMLNTSSGDSLFFSYIGFENKTIFINNRTEVNISLHVEVSSLDQVVVVGYGTQKKTSLTAAVSAMKGKEISSIPISDLSNALGGRMSGVIFRQGSGEPGQDASRIYIRGISTTGNNQPLLIVDDIPRSFQSLDPNSIGTITVLKDAAAVAPYGVAGANGVVLITTKRGNQDCLL